MKIFFYILFIMNTSLSFAVDLELTQGINSALPVAIANFGDTEEGHEITRIISNDLRLTGQFKIISNENMPALGQPSIYAFKQAGADNVVTGQLIARGGNHYEVRFVLIDATSGHTLLQDSLQTTKENLRRLAHHISDVVYQQLTGIAGVFSTHIAYILVDRANPSTPYSLVVADIDGQNPHNLVSSHESIMSPTWSPDGRKIAYVSFEKKKAQIFIINAIDGKRQLVTSFSGINGAPAWSPDGRYLTVVLSKTGSPKIYTVNLSNGRLQQLTFGDAIDTEPRFSPDGKSIIFTSGRGGSPQIYRLSLEDGKITRLTYTGNYNARAVFTPDGKNIVLMHRDENRNFSIAVQNLQTGELNPITHSSADESPSIAPNGRLVVYATKHQGKGMLGIVSIEGRTQLLLPARQGDMQEPAWSP